MFGYRKKTNINKCRQEYWKVKLSYIAGENINWYSYIEKQCGIYLEVKYKLLI